MRLVLMALAAAMLLTLPREAHAQLAVDRLWVDLDSQRTPRADILVRNESDEQYYINVQAFEIQNPGAKDEARVTKADPELLGILVTPSRMVMAPGAQRSVRVVGLDPNTAVDRVYRVLISPAVGALAAQEVPEGGRGMSIKLLTAFEVLVVARPTNAHADIVGERSAEQVIIRNTGNSNALLYDGLVCPPDANDEEGCASIPATRLYAGRELVVSLPSPDHVVRIRKRMRVSDNPSDLRF